MRRLPAPVQAHKVLQRPLPQTLQRPLHQLPLLELSPIARMQITCPLFSVISFISVPLADQFNGRAKLELCGTRKGRSAIRLNTLLDLSAKEQQTKRKSVQRCETPKLKLCCLKQLKYTNPQFSHERIVWMNT
ncbi:hypothetical protein Cfor_10739 [Coptotermes formosanus]|uniref:Uncharacterized protein n=1 Tax=Coptotermes formosanus TaxID=36987 RepID=A0A6L2PFD0_COPFO|nr:hypothetical protein Cfor_10739 [Coptotermes formosanus]